MDILEDMIAMISRDRPIRLTLEHDEAMRVAGAVNYHSLFALEKIKEALEDDSLDDFKCIEKILFVFENLDSSCYNRHDF